MKEGLSWTQIPAAVGISGILHQEQQWNGRMVLRPVYYGSPALNPTQMKYGAPKLEMLAVVTYVKKFHSYLAPRRFVLRVENQALSLVENVLHELRNGRRWLMCLDQYNMEIEHRPRTRHTNADGLSKITNLYVIKERSLKDNLAVREGFNFMDQEVYDALPTLDGVDKHGRQIEPEMKVKIVQKRTNPSAPTAIRENRDKTTGARGVDSGFMSEVQTRMPRGPNIRFRSWLLR